MPLTAEHVSKIKQIIRSKFTHQEIKPYLRRLLEAEDDREARNQMLIAVITTQKAASELKGHNIHHLIKKLCTKLIYYHEDILNDLQKIQRQMKH